MSPLSAQQKSPGLHFESDTQSDDRSSWSPANAVSLAAGLLTAFTVSIVGEMPVGELVLIAAVGWLALNVLTTKQLPGNLRHRQLLWVMLGAQIVASCAYVFSDLYGGSSLHDIQRGWARMGFLAIDILGIAYLFGSSRRNFIWYLTGQLAGDVIHALLFGALYDDLWKFGVGIPLTYLALALASRGGAWLTAGVACLAAVTHAAMDFRSSALACLAVAALTALQRLPRIFRLWVVPAMLIVTVAGFVAVRQIQANDPKRATRSDVARSSMLIAAWEGIQRHPLAGNGSWFSHSEVFADFMIIRQDRARLAHVGGFPEANEDPGTVAFHSQILVALAEGGIVGGCFFMLFGILLIDALYRLTFRRTWQPHHPVFALMMLLSLWNLGFSPFSGAHRVYVAATCGVLLLFYAEGERLRPRTGGPIR